MKNRNSCFAVLFASTITVAFTSLVQAGNTWDGGGGDNNWGTGANWSPDGSPSPGSSNDLFFGGSTRLSPFNNYAAFDDWRNITFNTGASSFNLFGNAIDLFGKIENLSSNTQTVSMLSVALNSASANEFNPVSGNLTILSTNLFTNGNQLNVFGNNGNTLSFGSSTIIQQGGAVSINQNSTVVYNSAHTYTGDTLINAGTLNFNSGASASSSIIRIGSTSGTASADVGLTSSAGGLSLGNTIVARSGTSGTRTIDSQNTSGTNTLTGVIALDAPLTLKQSSGGTLNLSGSFLDIKQQALTANTNGTVNISKPLNSSFTAGGTLIKQGGGTLLLSNIANNYTGTSNSSLNANGTQIAAGTLAIAADLSLGLAPGGAYNNLQFTGSGTLRSDAAISLNANRNISIASGATASFDSNGNTFTINGIVNGGGGLVEKKGAGTVIFAGTNTYTGTTSVSVGVLAVNGSLANTSTTVSGTGTLQGSGSTSGTVNISSGGTLASGANGIESFATGALSLASGSTFAYEVNKDAAATVAGDLTAITGGFNISTGAILTLAELGIGSWTIGEKLTLAGYSGAWNNGLFNYNSSSLADDSTFSFSGTSWLFNYNDAVKGTNFASELTGGSFMTMTVIPEPSAVLLGGIGMLALLRRRRI